MMKKYLMILSGAAVVVLLGAVPVRAHTWEGIDITPRAEVDETYDSNITSLKEDAVHDMRTDVLLGINLTKEEKTRQFTLDAEIARKMYEKNNTFDNTAFNLTGHYDADLSKYDHLRLLEAFSRSEEPMAFTDAFGAVNGLYKREHNFASVTYGHDINDQLDYRVSYANVMTNYPRAIGPDVMDHILGAGVDYSFSSANILSGDYSFRDEELTPGPSGNINEVTGKYRHFLTERLYADLIAGVDMIHDFNGHDKGYPVYRGRLTQEKDENTKISVSLDKEYSLSSSREDVFNNWRLSGELARQLRARLKGLLTVFYGEGKYVEEKDRVNLAGAEVGISYELTKQAALNLGYLFQVQNTTDQEGDYNRNLAYGGVTYKF